jgi:hypothetical protein
MLTGVWGHGSFRPKADIHAALPNARQLAAHGGHYFMGSHLPGWPSRRPLLRYVNYRGGEFMKVDPKRLEGLAQVVAGLVLSISVVTLLLGILPLESIFGFPNGRLLFFGGVGAVASVSFVMYRYLTGTGPLPSFGPSVTITQSTSSAADRDLLLKFADALELLKREIDEVRESQVQAVAGDREMLVEAMRPTLVEDVARSVEQQLAETVAEARRVQFIRENLVSNLARLRSETASLGRRAALNLTIGAVTTLIAASVLFYLVVAQEKQFDSVPIMLNYYIPRLSLVVFIEVFAFFFLRLYRATLMEIRVCQRETTDFALNISAIETAWASEEPSSKGRVAEAIVNGRAALGKSADREPVSVDPKVITDLLTQFAKVLNAK